MAYLGAWRINDVLTWYVDVMNPTTGQTGAPDADPGYRVYKNATTTPLLISNMSVLDSANTGSAFFYGQATLSVANGFSVGAQYAVRIESLIAGYTIATHHTWQITA